VVVKVQHLDTHQSSVFSGGRALGLRVCVLKLGG
jgi:hypothetical protein